MKTLSAKKSEFDLVLAAKTFCRVAVKTNS